MAYSMDFSIDVSDSSLGEFLTFHFESRLLGFREMFGVLRSEFVLSSESNSIPDG